MQINKRDIVLVSLLCIVFLSIATWNLGLTKTPTNTWLTTNKNEGVIVDFGSTQNIGNIYLLVKDGNTSSSDVLADIKVYSGSPESWSQIGNLQIKYNYYKWVQTSVNHDSQFLKFEFQLQGTSIEIAEIAALNQSNQRITISTVTAENITDPNLHRLIDEQDLVQSPPTYMTETMFDEVYFVRTSEQYLNRQYPYEWTHPPMGKILIAGGIAAFGFSPFGWRIMGVIFATLMIVTLYFLGKKLFGTWIGGFAAAFLLTFDFMHFTMARMGTADTYVVFFSLTSQLFFLIYLKNVLKDGWKTSILPLLLAVTFFALGFSTKWLVLYGFAAQLVVLLALRLKDMSAVKDGISKRLGVFIDHPFAWLLIFLLLAGFIYVLTYIPDMLAGRTLAGIFDLQFGMFRYHSELTATHPYSSQWWSWPLMLSFESTQTHAPLWLYVSYLPNSIKSTIWLFGNPAVWWTGFAAVLLVTVNAVSENDIARGMWRRLTKKPAPQTTENQLPEGSTGTDININVKQERGYDFAAVFIAVFFFFQWLPYVLISRVTFIYHFYVSVPFLCLASAYFINRYWNTRLGKIATIIYFAVVIAVFIFFYSIIAGVPIAETEISKFQWFGKGWIF